MKTPNFEQWVHLPQNLDRNYEYIRGEITEIIPNSKSSNLGLLIGSFITVHVLNHDLGHTTGADGGYQVEGERYIPDVGFISKKRMPDLEDATYISIAPNLAVEVVSPSDSQRKLTVKIGNYLAAGTTVWVVYPDEQAIDIYAPNKTVVHLTKSDTLDGGAILPEFKLPLKQIFK